MHACMHESNYLDHQHSHSLASDFASPFRDDRETTDNNKQRALRKQPAPRIDSESIPIVSIFFTICTPIKNLRRQFVSYLFLLYLFRPSIISITTCFNLALPPWGREGHLFPSIYIYLVYIYSGRNKTKTRVHLASTKKGLKARSAIGISVLRRHASARGYHIYL